MLETIINSMVNKYQEALEAVVKIKPEVLICMSTFIKALDIYIHI